MPGAFCAYIYCMDKTKIWQGVRRHAAVLLALAWAGLSVAANSLTQGALAVDSPNANRPICNAGANNNRAAISFDSDWGADKTLQILDILDFYEVKATFFLTGYWVQANPDLTRDIHERGHEIGNHSTAHSDMSRMAREEIIADIEQAGSLIADITGRRPTLFRPPYGNCSVTLMRTAAALGYHVVQWDIDTRDYDGDTAQDILSRTQGLLKDGSIILMHNNSLHISGALPLLLTEFARVGLRQCIVSELIGPDDYTVDRDGTLVRLAN